MKSLILLVSGLFTMAASSAAPVTCPGYAPADWNVGRRPLESVRVMSYPVAEKIGADRDYYATPPWDEREKAGFIYQTWHMNRDVSEFTYQVDCVYAGTNRYLGLKVSGTRKCIARWRARSDHGVVPYSLYFFCS